MAARGVCEICGFADDSYRIEENGAVMKVCKLCYDGYHERMGTSPETADKAALSNQTANISLDDIPPDDKAEIARILKEEKKLRSRVPTLNATQLDMVLEPSDDDRRVLSNVRRRQLRKERRAAVKGEQVAWADVNEDIESDDDESEEELIVRSAERTAPKPKPKARTEKPETPGKEVLRARIQSVIDSLDGTEEVLNEFDEEPRPQETENDAAVDANIPEEEDVEKTAEDTPEQLEEQPAKEQSEEEVTEGQPEEITEETADEEPPEQFTEETEEGEPEEVAEDTPEQLEEETAEDTPDEAEDITEETADEEQSEDEPEQIPEDERLDDGTSEETAEQLEEEPEQAIEEEQQGEEQPEEEPQDDEQSE